MIAQEEDLRRALKRVVERAAVEAAAGAPSNMVAFYVEAEARHTLACHDGDAQECSTCYEASGRDL